jgi:hypothetical protein
LWEDISVAQDGFPFLQETDFLETEERFLDRDETFSMRDSAFQAIKKVFGQIPPKSLLG